MKCGHPPRDKTKESGSCRPEGKPREQLCGPSRRDVSNLAAIATGDVLTTVGQRARFRALNISACNGVRGGEPLLEDHVLIQWFSPPDGIEGRTVIGPDDWKLALCAGDNSLLFDRRRDPLEMNNLFGRDSLSTSVASRRKRLGEWQLRVEDSSDHLGS